MSWTTFFPVFDEAMLEAYQKGVSWEETAEFEEWFGIKTQDPKRQFAEPEAPLADQISFPA